jgi:hypothetical protein
VKRGAHRLSGLLPWLLLLASCRRAGVAVDPCFAEATDVVRLAERFEKDADFRRDCLVRSLGGKQNQYTRDRIVHYNDGDWGQRPVLAFKTRPVLPSDLGRPAPTPDTSWQAIPVGDFPDTPDGLERRGQQMFARFPAQLERSMLPILRDADKASRYGLWQTSDSVGGLVWVALPGGVFPALTCSTCHASVDDRGKLVAGAPNHGFDLGKAKDDYVNVHSLYSTWGPGREDIASDGKDDPVVMADLRPVRFQSYLHRTANVKSSLAALALRVETGLITAHLGSVRPERKDAFALAYYLWSLGETVRPAPPPPAAFERHCGACHKGPALAGQLVAPATIHSPIADMPNTARGTGMLRVPSLLGVADRRLLLYGGEAKGIDALLAPDRVDGGHAVGAALTSDEREAIASYLRSL